MDSIKYKHLANENEYYASIHVLSVRLKRVSALMALINRGVQYIEVRCLDVDPFEPSALVRKRLTSLMPFYCIVPQGKARFSMRQIIVKKPDQNFNTVVMEGRRPNRA